MHSCGAYAPGEVCWNVVDPTVNADGISIWENGALYPDRIPGGDEILAQYPDLKKVFENPDQRIGF